MEQSTFSGFLVCLGDPLEHKIHLACCMHQSNEYSLAVVQFPMLIAHTQMDQDSINALRENLVDMLKYGAAAWDDVNSFNEQTCTILYNQGLMTDRQTNTGLNCIIDGCRRTTRNCYCPNTRMPARPTNRLSSHRGIGPRSSRGSGEGVSRNVGEGPSSRSYNAY